MRQSHVPVPPAIPHARPLLGIWRRGIGTPSPSLEREMGVRNSDITSFRNDISLTICFPCFLNRMITIRKHLTSAFFLVLCKIKMFFTGIVKVLRYGKGLCEQLRRQG